jgi:hypothetical protein
MVQRYFIILVIRQSGGTAVKGVCVTGVAIRFFVPVVSSGAVPVWQAGMAQFFHPDCYRDPAKDNLSRHYGFVQSRSHGAGKLFPQTLEFSVTLEAFVCRMCLTAQVRFKVV